MKWRNVVKVLGFVPYVDFVAFPTFNDITYIIKLFAALEQNSLVKLDAAQTAVKRSLLGKINKDIPQDYGYRSLIKSL